jgi:hypothetical protein
MSATPPRGVIVVDFDGTICEHRYPDFGEPLAGAREALQRLHTAGFRIIIHTVRTASRFTASPGYRPEVHSPEAVQDYLQRHDIPFDEIWMHDKPAAMLYIDDRGMRVLGDRRKSNWHKIVKTLLPQEPRSWGRLLGRWLR